MLSIRRSKIKYSGTFKTISLFISYITVRNMHEVPSMTINQHKTWSMANLFLFMGADTVQKAQKITKNVSRWYEGDSVITLYTVLVAGAGVSMDGGANPPCMIIKEAREQAIQNKLRYNCEIADDTEPASFSSNSGKNIWPCETETIPRKRYEFLKKSYSDSECICLWLVNANIIVIQKHSNASRQEYKNKLTWYHSLLQ